MSESFCLTLDASPILYIFPTYFAIHPLYPENKVLKKQPSLISLIDIITIIKYTFGNIILL